MAKIGKAEIAVGDLLRRDSDDREGTVISVSDEEVTVRIPGNFLESEADVTAPASQWHYNTWDSKYADSEKTPPVQQPSNMEYNEDDPETQRVWAVMDADNAAGLKAIEEAKIELAAEIERVKADEEARVAALIAAREDEERAFQTSLDAARAEGAALALNSVELAPDEHFEGEPLPPVQTEEENNIEEMGEVQPPEVTETE